MITECPLQVVPLKARVARTEYVSNKDILSISVGETIPIDPVEEESSGVITTNNAPSSQQGQTTATFSTINENTIHNSQGNACGSEQTTEDPSYNNTETISSPNETVAVELESPKMDGVRKAERNVQKERNKNEIPMEVTVESIPSITDGVSELVEFQGKGNSDVCEDINTNDSNLITKAEAKPGVDKHTEEDSINEHNCQQHEETINSLPSKQTVIEKQHDEDVPIPIAHTCHSNTDAVFYEEVNHQNNDNIIVADISSECIITTSPTETEYDVTKQTDGLDPNVVHQQTCEGSVTTHGDSIPVGVHDNLTVNCNNASLLPNMDQESPSNSLQGSVLVTCGVPAPRESLGEQNVNNNTDGETRQEMDILGTSTATTKLEVQQKQKSARKKKRVSRKKKGRGRPKKTTNIVNQGITAPDSTGTRVDCSVDLLGNTDNTSVNSGTKSSPEPSVSSTSNGATDAPNMECSSNYKRAAIHDDEEFVTPKKLKLDDNPITSPGNLVTSTSSDNVGNVVNRNVFTLLGDDNTVSRLSPTTELDTVPTTMDEGNSSVNDGKVPSRGAGKPTGINGRKCQRPKKRRKNMAVGKVLKAKKVDSNDNDFEEGVEANGDVNNDVTTTDAIQQRTHNKSELYKPWESARQYGNEITQKEQLQEASAITRCIKYEPEAHTLSHVPVTKDRWV